MIERINIVGVVVCIFSLFLLSLIVFILIPYKQIDVEVALVNDNIFEDFQYLPNQRVYTSGEDTYEFQEAIAFKYDKHLTANEISSNFQLYNYYRDHDLIGFSKSYFDNVDTLVVDKNIKLELEKIVSIINAYNHLYESTSTSKVEFDKKNILYENIKRFNVSSDSIYNDKLDLQNSKYKIDSSLYNLFSFKDSIDNEVTRLNDILNNYQVSKNILFNELQLVDNKTRDVEFIKNLDQLKKRYKGFIDQSIIDYKRTLINYIDNNFFICQFEECEVDFFLNTNSKDEGTITYARSFNSSAKYQTYKFVGYILREDYLMLKKSDLESKDIFLKLNADQSVLVESFDINQTPINDKFEIIIYTNSGDFNEDTNIKEFFTSKIQCKLTYRLDIKHVFKNLL
jgi:hypothetical protein